MFPVHVSQPGMQGLHAPNVCPEEPTGTTIFCKEHSSLAQERGYPMHVKEFLHYCGASQTAGKLLLQIFSTTVHYMLHHKKEMRLILMLTQKM